MSRGSFSNSADVEVQTGNKAYWFRLDDKGELVGGISKFLADPNRAGGQLHTVAHQVILVCVYVQRIFL